MTSCLNPRVACVLGFAFFLTGCPVSANGDGEGGTPITALENRGTGYLADGADPFPRDVASADVGDAGTWTLGDGGLPLSDSRYGQIYMGLYASQAPTISFVDVLFRFKEPSESRCDSGTLGAWSYRDCPEGEELDDHPRPFPNAGEFQVLGSNNEIMLSLLDDGRYDAWQLTRGEAFAPNQTLTLRAGGGVVPAFTHTVHTVPTIQSHNVAGLDANLIVRTQPITVRWMPTTVERVTVSLRQRFTDQSGAHDLYLSADFEGDVEGAQVPSVMLARLKTGQLVELRVTPFTRETFEVGAWPIYFQFDGRGTWQNIGVR